MTMSGHADREDGFTMVELMVVVLIIGLLIAIALPTFLGARERTQDRAAQTDLRTALAAALTHWAASGSYAGFDVAEAERSEPSLEWRPQGTPPAVREITIQRAVGTELLLVTRARSGVYFCLRQLANSPAFDRGVGAAFADVDDPAECTGGW
jgi:type IV pilus assembly protein PilA